jgi:peroxiredoxin
MANRRVGLVSFLLALMAPAALWAAGEPAGTGGPAVGDRFPEALELRDQDGHAQSLHTLMGPKGLAVFFVRSADWCPFCKGQLVDTNRHLAAFRKQGIEVVSVSVDEVEPIAVFAKEQYIGYRMLSDPHGDINLRLGIRDTQYPVGSRAFGVPRPTLYVLDRAARIRLRYQEPTYQTRPDQDGVLKDIAALGL